MTRIFKNIFEKHLQPMAEYDLRLFKSADEINYLRSDFPQFDLLVITSMVLLFLCQDTGRQSTLPSELETHSFK